MIKTKKVRLKKIPCIVKVKIVTRRHIVVYAPSIPAAIKNMEKYIKSGVSDFPVESDSTLCNTPIEIDVKILSETALPSDRSDKED